MVALIAEDHDLDWDDVLAGVGSAGGVAATLGRPHIADALVAKGLVADRDEAFATLLHRGSPYYVYHYAPVAQDLVAAVVDAGGVPVIAHPRAGRRGRTLSDSQLESLVAAGMAGLEVDHRDHTPSDRRQLRDLAARLGVFTTGSSDYHGAGKPNVLGENVTSPRSLDRLLVLGRGTKAYLP
jgi:predicted metal-dependent phosphoesterase TrpH